MKEPISKTFIFFKTIFFSIIFKISFFTGRKIMSSFFSDFFPSIKKNLIQFVYKIDLDSY